MSYVLIYKNGDFSITKIIEASSKDEALDIFLKDYQDHDITRNEVDIMVHNDVKELVTNFWKTVNADK